MNPDQGLAGGEEFGLNGFGRASAVPEMSFAASLQDLVRLYCILDTQYVRAPRWKDTCRALIDGGADLVQIRAKDVDAFERRALVEEVLPLFSAGGSGAGIPLVINDDVAVANELGLAGAHVGQDDLPPQECANLLGPGRLLGMSTHSLQQARQALALGPRVLSYFAVGPVFATPTKPTYAAVGLELVRQVAALRPALPVFCIGGVNRDTVRSVVDAGATRVVVVSAVLTARDPAAAAAEIKRQLPMPRIAA